MSETSTMPVAATPLVKASSTWNEAAIRSISASLGEPEKVLALRLEAFSRLRLTPWPTVMDEAWRRNDPRLIGRDKFVWWNPGSSSAEFVRSEPFSYVLGDLESSKVVLDNCRMVSKSVLSEKHQGLQVGTLQQGFQTRSVPELEQLVLDVPDDKDSPAVSLLHLAFSQGGSYVVVPKGWDSAQPVILRHKADHPGAALFPLNVIKLGDDARMTLVLEQDDLTKTESWWGSSTRIVLGARAKLNMVLINRGGSSVRFYDHLQATLGREAHFSLTWGDLTQGWAVMRRETFLAGPGSEANLRGAFVGSQSAQIDIRTLQDHTAEATMSDLMFKAVNFGSSKSVYQGLIKVGTKAVLANAYQLNRNLLMSSAARADSIPKLEILVDEVRCTHGASAGKPDPNNVFYLRSRGLTEVEAMNLLVKGFLAEAGALLKESPLEEYWRDAIIGEANKDLAAK